jgi:hypothetical protein
MAGSNNGPSPGLVAAAEHWPEPTSYLIRLRASKPA